MNHLPLKLSVIILTFVFCLPCFAQTQNITSKSKLFIEVAEDEKTADECEQKKREYQILKFGKALPKISGHCWDGCPTNVVLPYYPREARRKGISGQVKVETMVDESGKVVFAKIIQGQPYLNQTALKAAYLSTHTPKKTCDDKLIKFRWIITYNFH